MNASQGTGVQNSVIGNPPYTTATAPGTIAPGTVNAGAMNTRPTPRTMCPATRRRRPRASAPVAIMPSTRWRRPCHWAPTTQGRGCALWHVAEDEYLFIDVRHARIHHGRPDLLHHADPDVPGPPASPALRRAVPGNRVYATAPSTYTYGTAPGTYTYGTAPGTYTYAPAAPY